MTSRNQGLRRNVGREAEVKEPGYEVGEKPASSIYRIYKSLHPTIKFELVQFEEFFNVLDLMLHLQNGYIVTESHIYLPFNTLHPYHSKKAKNPYHSWTVDVDGDVDRAHTLAYEQPTNRFLSCLKILFRVKQKVVKTKGNFNPYFVSCSAYMVLRVLCFIL